MLDPDMSNQQLRLNMGELSLKECRVVRATIRWANAAAMHSLAKPIMNEEEAVLGMARAMRSCLTRLLIRLAMRTCVSGWAHDHLIEALKYEKALRQGGRI